MSVNSTFDVDSVGGGFGGLGGLGGFGGGALPLWLLLFLGLGKDGGGLFGGNSNSEGASFVAGQNAADIQCLKQGQTNIADQIAFNRSNDQFSALGGQISDLAGIQRDATAAITAQNNDLSRQVADCCCDLKVGQQAIRTDVAMQTCDINQNTNAGIQRIADLLSAQTIEQKNDRIRELEQASQTATLSAVIRDVCAASGVAATTCGGTMASFAQPAPRA